MQVSPTQSNVQAALAAFLSAVLPGLNGSQPAVFVGAINATTLTVTALPGATPGGIQGIIQANAPLLGLGLASGTTIVRQLTGPTGGVGTYQISVSQTVATPITMSTGVTIIAGQQNRVIEPVNPYFVVMTPIRFTRLATNIDTKADVKFTGSISASTLTVSDVAFGEIELGATVFGTGVAANTIITAFGSGSGGAGTYTISGSQTIGSQTLSAGQKTLTQEAESVVQIDCHSPDTQGGDLAQIVSTALRDEYATTFFAGLTPPFNDVSPFYADDPKQVPFVNAENAYEWRWVLEAHFQVNQTVVVPQTYADAAAVTLADVNALYPP